MSGMRWLMGVATGLSVGCLVAVGCGGTTTVTTVAPIDAGPDTATDATTSPDATPDVVKDAPPPSCVNDADLETTTVPDASIGDAGGSTAKCMACARKECASEIAECNKECECRELVSELF